MNNTMNPSTYFNTYNQNRSFQHLLQLFFQTPVTTQEEYNTLVSGLSDDKLELLNRLVTYLQPSNVPGDEIKI